MRCRPSCLISTRAPAIGLVAILLSGTLSFGAKIPGETLGSKTLQRDTERQILLMDRLMASECQTRKVVRTEVIARPAVAASSGRVTPGPWQERWHVDRCGAVVAWDVHYMPSARGGTDIGVGLADLKAGAAVAPSGVNADLLAAAESGDTARIDALLGNGADIATRNMNGLTPLMVASMKGHVDAVEALLKKGSDLNLSEKYGATALHLAALNGRNEVIKVLLAHGADVNTKANGDNLGRALRGETPLMEASSGQAETVRLLIDSGADVNARNGAGQTPLMRAAMNGASESVILLLERGADAGAVDEDGRPVLAMVGGKCLSPEATRALIEHSRPKQPDLNGVLLEAATGEHGHSCIAFMETLLANGADVNRQAGYGNTALILAARWGNREQVEFLLSRGADVTLKNRDGHTARDAASTREIADLLKAAAKAR